VPHDALLAACETLEGYSNADLEALALLAAEFAERGARVADFTLPPAAAGGAAVTPALLAQASEDFMPPQETAMVRYMEMLAVAETSRRSLLPQRFRSLSAVEVQERLAELRRQILP
jgi:hypothetical protein